MSIFKLEEDCKRFM